MIAALYVETNGVYSTIEGVDLWDESRDARRYCGPHPVVAHPPCQRWGNFSEDAIGSVRYNRPRKIMGDDGGCFESALASVRAFGGVLEHPRGSKAWERFRIVKPITGNGWVKADGFGGWTCCVEQGNYGHRARKATWLYAVGTELPELIWTPSNATVHATPAPKWQPKRPYMQQKERRATPRAFAELLVSMARSVRYVA